MENYELEVGVQAYLSLGQLGLDGRPSLTLGSITEQVHDDGALGDGLVDFEQILAGNPAILYSFFPRDTVLSDTNDDIETVVTEVETLTVTLRAIANQGESVILEVLLKR